MQEGHNVANCRDQISRSEPLVYFCTSPWSVASAYSGYNVDNKFESRFEIWIETMEFGFEFRIWKKKNKSNTLN